MKRDWLPELLFVAVVLALSLGVAVYAFLNQP